MRFAVPLAFLAAAIVLLALDVEPVPTWFYVFAWYPTLFIMHQLAGRPRWPGLVSAWAWSAPIWLVFEAFNFRLENWYYVFVPRNPTERWAGIVVAFATVVPAVLLAERALRAWGLGLTWRSRPFPVARRDLRGALALGAGMLALSLGWPRTFFPLVWGAVLLLCEPFVFRRRPELSLFADVSRGEWGRVGRLLVGGLAIGFLWEGFNYWARGRWIYTVPWLEELKLFEMPPFGFVGFPFFALEAWAMYHALCAARLAIPLDHPGTIRLPRLAVAIPLTAVLSVAVIMGMERQTISSVVPALRDIPGISAPEAAQLRAAGVSSVMDLARTPPRGTADSVAALARLSVLRGIGARHARRLAQLGIRDACQLATWNPGALLDALQEGAGGDPRPTGPEVRVWHRAASRAC